jgi:hypothetical protein
MVTSEEGRAFIRSAILRAMSHANLKQTAMAAMMGISLGQLSAQLATMSREQLSIQRLMGVKEPKFWDSLLEDLRAYHASEEQRTGMVEQAMAQLLISLDNMTAELRLRRIAQAVVHEAEIEQRA